MCVFKISDVQSKSLNIDFFLGNSRMCGRIINSRINKNIKSFYLSIYLTIYHKLNN